MYHFILGLRGASPKAPSPVADATVVWWGLAKLRRSLPSGDRGGPHRNDFRPLAQTRSGGDGRLCPVEERQRRGHVLLRLLGHDEMAAALDEETCRRVHLGFMDQRKFRREDYENDRDTLVVERAGRDLYLVAPN